MKLIYRFVVLSCMLFIAVHTNAQAKKAHSVTVCNIVQEGNSGNISKDEPLVLYIQDSVSNQKLAIVFSQHVIKGMSYNPRQKLVNQKACISGMLKTYNNQPAIFISSEKQINTSEKPEVNKISSNG